MPPILMCFFGCFPQVFVAYLRKNLIFTLLALYPSFCLFWAICGILIQLLSWSSPRHTRRTPKYIVDMYICISYVYIYIYILCIYIYTHWHRRHESIMNTMFVIVYDCILNYVTACDCIHSFSSFPVVHKAKMPTLGMLMLDQKTSKKELGGFDHPGQAQRYETWVFNMNVQKDGKVKLTFMILMKVNRCSFGSRIWLSLSHCVHLTGSFSYQLKQEVVKGLTLDICHSGKLTPELEKSFTSSISALEVPRFSNTRRHALKSNGGGGSLSFTVKLQRNWGSRSFGDLWRHGFHDVVSILGAEKHQVTSDSQLMLEGKAWNSM